MADSTELTIHDRTGFMLRDTLSIALHGCNGATLTAIATAIAAVEQELQAGQEETRSPIAEQNFPPPNYLDDEDIELQHQLAKQKLLNDDED